MQADVGIGPYEGRGLRRGVVTPPYGGRGDGTPGSSCPTGDCSLYTREPLDCAARSVAKMGDNLSGAARQLPWKGSLFRCGGAKKTEIVLAFLRGMCYNNNENHY